MKLNKQLFQDFKDSESKLLAVTKYWDLDETNNIISQLSEQDSEALIWLGENRVNALKQKDLEREATHFIGNIQTKEIKFITKHCSTIHSLDNLKQIRKINDICEKQWNWVKVFIQINIDPEKEGWISPDKIPEFMSAIDETDNISLLWFSAIWKTESTEQERREEFILLKELRNKYLQNGLVSAGTSRDYKIAIDEEINIIRVGKSLIIED